MESLILKFIKENPRTWRSVFEKKGINIKEDGVLTIFKYGIECDFSDPIVQEARGIIIDMSSFKVVCWPFRKFGNYGESYADEIDWNSAKVQEKVDGSIIKLYWYNNQWNWSTNGVIYAYNAELQGLNMTYQDLILKTQNYNKIDFNSLNHNYTYIFELVSPYNRIVVEYNIPMLYHIGTRNNITGEELNINIGIQKPKEYLLHNLESALAASTDLNKGAAQSQILEGFVVVDKNWHRIKIKTPEYLAQHNVWGNGSLLLNKTIAVTLALDFNNEHWKDFQSTHHPYMAQIRYYQYQIENLKWEIDRFILVVRSLYEEYSHERKAVANKIKHHRLSYFGFKSLDNDLKSDDLLKTLSPNRIINFLPDYSLPEFTNDLSFGLKVLE